MAINIDKKFLSIILVAAEVFLLAVLFSAIPAGVLAGIGTPNATVKTNLTVGNVYPEVLNVSIDADAASITLTPNSTKTVFCAAVVRDFNGQADITSVNATFYDSVVSSHGAADDNNDHYTNSSCDITLDTGGYNGFTDDAYNVLSNCTFQVEYYANPETWNCNVTATDSYSWIDSDFDIITMSQLLSIELPDVIDYGEVNATAFSSQNITNVTNRGNVALNLSLEGYGFVEEDGNAMNCTLGSNGNISIEHEKYNLTASHPGTLTAAQIEANYTNLTTTAVIKNFNLTRRQNDAVNEAWNQTYWRIYVPTGVAGTCEGFIKFGATTANGNN